MKKKRSARDILRDKAWDVFSVFIRTRDKGTCYTCGKRIWDEEKGEYTIKGFNAGHFKHAVLDFDEENIHCQCVQCNKWNSGRLDVYGEKLLKELGLKRFKALLKRASMAQKGQKLSEEEYKEIIIKYTDKLREL